MISPFTVLKVAPSGESARPIDASIDPLTVLARTEPVVATLTDPFTV